MRLIGKLLAAGLVLVLLLALAGEVLLRWRASRSPTNSISVQTYRHQRVQEAMVRNVDYHGAHINRYGFRGPDIPVAKPAGVTRIIVLGQSTAFDTCVQPDSATWPARLEHWLEQMMPGRQFEVINAGVPQIVMLDQIIRLQRELYAFEPDMLLLYAGHGVINRAHLRPQYAESLDSVSSATPEAVPPQGRVATWLAMHSRLYQRLAGGRRPAATHPGPVDAQQWAAATDLAAREFQRDVTSFALIGRSFGAKIALVEIARVTGTRTAEQLTPEERAMWDRAYDAPPEVILAGYERFKQAWAAAADSVGGIFIPADSLNITGPANYCVPDPIHFTPAGAEAMGRRVAQLLVAQHAF